MTSTHSSAANGEGIVGEPTSSTHRYYPALDGLRAVAFLMVFGAHYLQLPWGFTGVDCFFVLSGFLITGILYDTRNDPDRARTFYLRRTLRIFPLYYAVVLALLLLDVPFRWRWSAAWWVWPAYLGNYVRWFYPAPFLSPLQLLADAQLISKTHPALFLRFGHFWSLCVEEQFYLVWPWVVFWVRDRRRLIVICIATVIICPALRVLLSYTLPDYLLAAEVLYRTTPLRIDALLLGGFIALVHRTSYATRLLAAARVVFAALLAFILAWHIVARPFALSYQRYRYPSPAFSWCSWCLTIADLVFASLIVFAIHPGTFTSRVLGILPLRWLGRITYGAYVFHDVLHTPMEALIRRHIVHHAYLVTALTALAITIPLSWASFRWLESPFLRLKPAQRRRPPDLLVGTTTARAVD